MSHAWRWPASETLRRSGNTQNEHMFSGLPPKADLRGHRSKQRRQHGAPLVRHRVAHGGVIALDQAADDHLLRRGVRDAGRLPIGV
jgi:hypothetical protein